ncbi:MAG: hypothetical protein R3F55_23380 [Alphaproteobacteria bacterium]
MIVAQARSVALAGRAAAMVLAGTLWQSAAAQSVAVDACAAPPAPIVLDLQLRQTPQRVEPRPREAYVDPAFGTCIVRVTDRDADLADGDDPAGIKNEYSRVQAFNADGGRFLLRSVGGGWYLYDARTLRPLAGLPLGIDPRWDAADPARILFSDGTRLMAHLTDSGATRIVRDFATDLPGRDLAAVWTRYEGSPSADGRYWAMMAEDGDWLAAALLVYDALKDRIVGLHPLDGWPAEAREIDSVTVSPLGTYVLAYLDRYCERGTLGSDADPCGLMVYDRSLAQGRGLLRIVGHSDLALDAAGREVLVFQDIDNDTIAMLDLASGAVTPLLPIDFSHSPLGFHFSGQAFGRPGWAVVSTYSGGQPAAGTWMDDQVFLLELKPGGRVVRLAHTHAVVDQAQEHDYWAEPQATANRDLTRILFTSNWGRSGTQAVDTYMIVLPDDWSDALPAR